MALQIGGGITLGPGIRAGNTFPLAVTYILVAGSGAGGWAQDPTGVWSTQSGQFGGDTYHTFTSSGTLAA